MRHIKPNRAKGICRVFEEFDEVTQIVVAILEDEYPARVQVPGSNILVWELEETKGDIDWERMETMLGDAGYGLYHGHPVLTFPKNGIHEYYIVAYKNDWMNGIISIDDLNSAVFEVQSEIGQDDGGNAGIFFDGGDFQDDQGRYVNAEEYWKKKDKRKEAILEYLVWDLYQMKRELNF